MTEFLIQNVPVKDVAADECWSYIGTSEKSKRGENLCNNELGDCYCWASHLDDFGIDGAG